MKCAFFFVLIFIGTTITGCEKPCVGEGCESAGDDDGVIAATSAPTPTQSPAFWAQLKIVAPYSWTGTFYAFPYDGRPSDPDCEGTNECLVDLDNEGTLQVAITGDIFHCVNQFVTIGQANNNQTVELIDGWLEEGQCYLAPEGDYGTYEIFTEVKDNRGWIWLGSWGAVVTENTFFYEDDEYLLEGQISQDLSEIYYHRILSTGETEGTLHLQ